MTLLRVVAENKWPVFNTFAAGGASAISAVQQWTLGHYIQLATLALIVVQLAYTVWKFRREREKERRAKELDYPTLDKPPGGRDSGLLSRLKRWVGNGKTG